MNLNAAFQPTVAGAHLLSIALLIGIAASFGSRRWATALSIVSITTSGVVTLGLAGLLLVFAAAGGGPGLIPPLAFAGGIAAAFVAYLLVFALAWALRPRPLQFSAAVWCITLLGFATFNSIFLALPTAAASSITVCVRTADCKPVSGATLTYKTQFNRDTVSETSDSEGRITLHPKLGDTIDGQFAASTQYAEVKLSIFARKHGGSRWGIHRRWLVPFGTNTLASCSFFISDFDNPREGSIVVYLPRSDRAEVMPYAELSNLAARLQKAQRTGQVIYSEIYPEMNVQNLESYRQLAEVVQTYDPHSPVRGCALSILSYLTRQHNSLESILKKLSDPKLDSAIRDHGLAQMVAILQIPSPDSLSWQERRDLIQARLDSDLTTIKNLPKP